MFFRSSLQLALGLVATGSLVAAAPCDIYQNGNTPCVAAHSTTRALYSAYSGRLYQIMRGSDSATTDISAKSAGGVANAAAQDNFCAGTTCVISIIYDQSGRNNHLTRAPPGGAASGPAPNGFDDLASAVGAPVTLNGNKAYGVFIQPRSGYRNDRTTGIAVGDQPEGMYAVLDGTHYNDACCFDYGNAETNNLDNGAGHMETIYFGSNRAFGYGAGPGPWILADMEDGTFSQQALGQNPNDPTLSARFAVTVVKGKANQWAIRGGDGSAGSMSTFFSGPRLNGYNPMRKEGAIILGIGGDNSNGAQGTFYEGVITSGYPSDATENAVQQNIVAQKYAQASLNSGPGVTVGRAVTLRVTTPGFTNRYLAHSGNTVNTQVITSSSSTATKQTGMFTIRAGLAKSQCYSFESVDTPGSFIRHRNFELHVDASDGSKLFGEDATYCLQAGLNGKGNSVRSYSFPTRYFRHYNALGYLASNGGPEVFDNMAQFNNDVSFIVGSGFQA